MRLVACRDSDEFSSKLEHALSSEPVPMTADLQKRLTWEDATERFLDVAQLKASERPGVVETAVDTLAWVAHNTLTGKSLSSSISGLVLCKFTGSNNLLCRPQVFMSAYLAFVWPGSAACTDGALMEICTTWYSSCLGGQKEKSQL